MQQPAHAVSLKAPIFREDSLFHFDVVSAETSFISSASSLNN